MELSEREKRLLQEMETRLLAEDPRLASSLRFHRLRVGVRVLLAGAGLVLGVVLMVVGVGQAPRHLVGYLLAWLGFTVLVLATNAAVESWLARASHSSQTSGAARRARRAS